MTPPSTTTIVTASMHIENLKGFKKLDKTRRIVTYEFLESSRELVSMLNDSFGSRITLISSELLNNCDKIEKVYRKNPNEYKYLDAMIVATINRKKCVAPTALIWLNMGLDLIVQFFTSIINDQTLDEDLREHITNAYDCTLKPHHNYFLREMVSMLYTFMPTRSKLLGEGSEYLANISRIDKFLANIRDNVIEVYEICNKNNVGVC